MSQNAKIIDVTKSYIPGDPGAFPGNLGYTQSEDNPEKMFPILPYEGWNFLPTAYGYRSYFGINQTFVTDHPLPHGRFDYVLMYQTATYENVLIALGSDGIYTFRSGTTDWVHEVALTDYYVSDQEFREWSYSVVENVGYFYRQAEALVYKIIFTTGVLSSFAPTFLNMAGQIGIFRANGRLGFWDSANSISWSSPYDTSNFTPDIETLVGNTIFNAIVGRIVTIKSSGDGFIIYATKSITRVNYTTAGSLIWDAVSITTESGIGIAKNVTTAENDKTHYAYTTTGLLKIGGYNVVTKQNAVDPIAVREIDFLRESRKPVYLSCVDARYLYLSLIDNNYIDGITSFGLGTVPDVSITPVSLTDYLALLGDSPSTSQVFTAIYMALRYPDGATLSKPTELGNYIVPRYVVQMTNNILNYYAKSQGNLDGFYNDSADIYLPYSPIDYLTSYSTRIIDLSLFPSLDPLGNQSFQIVDIITNIFWNTIEYLWFQATEDFTSHDYASQFATSRLLGINIGPDDINLSYSNTIFNSLFSFFSMIEQINYLLKRHLDAFENDLINKSYTASFALDNFYSCQPVAPEANPLDSFPISKVVQLPLPSDLVNVSHLLDGDVAIQYQWTKFKVYDVDVIFDGIKENWIETDSEKESSAWKITIIRQNGSSPVYLGNTIIFPAMTGEGVAPTIAEIVAFYNLNPGVTNVTGKLWYPDKDNINNAVNTAESVLGYPKMFFTDDTGLITLTNLLVVITIYQTNIADGIHDIGSNSMRYIALDTSALDFTQFSAAMPYLCNPTDDTYWRYLNWEVIKECWLQYFRYVRDFFHGGIVSASDPSITVFVDYTTLLFDNTDNDYLYITALVRTIGPVDHGRQRVALIKRPIIYHNVGNIVITYSNPREEIIIDDAIETIITHSITFELQSLDHITRSDGNIDVLNSQDITLDVSAVEDYNTATDFFDNDTTMGLGNDYPILDSQSENCESWHFLGKVSSTFVDAPNGVMAGLPMSLGAVPYTDPPRICSGISSDPLEFDYLSPFIYVGTTFVLQDGTPAPLYPTLKGALVFDLALQKWGKLKADYKVILEISPINSTNNAQISYTNFGMDAGILTSSGDIKIFDSQPTDAWIRYGKIGYYRKGFTVSKEVLADFRTNATGSIIVDASFDGRNLDPTLTYTMPFTDVNTIIAYPDVNGKWHTISIYGIFDLQFLEFRGTIGGRR